MAAWSARAARGRWNEPAPGDPPISEGQSPAARALTEVDGSFIVEGLDPLGHYDVVVEGDGRSAMPHAEAGADPLDSWPHDVRLTIPSGAPLLGSVSGLPRGRPAWAQLRACLRDAFFTSGWMWSTPWQQLTPAGDLRFSSVPRGVVAVVVHIPGLGTWSRYEDAWSDRLDVPFQSLRKRAVGVTEPEKPRPPAAADIVLGNLAGVARDAGGAAVPHAYITARPGWDDGAQLHGGPWRQRYVVTDANGRFELRGLPVRARWTLDARTADARYFLRGSPSARVPTDEPGSVELTMARRAWIRGRVELEDGTPVSHVDVEAVDWDRGRGGPRRAIARARAVTNADGHFEMVNDGALLEVVHAELMQLELVRPRRPKLADVDVEHVIRVRRVPRPTWRGRVTDVRGRPLAWRPVWVYVHGDGATRDVPLAGGHAFSMTDEKGHFVLTLRHGQRLPDAQYEIYVDGQHVAIVPFGGADNLELRAERR
ncbi:MAG: hypothetical protein AB7T63_16415 [Planctomycetota bacterium]